MPFGVVNLVLLMFAHPFCFKLVVCKFANLSRYIDAPLVRFLQYLRRNLFVLFLVVFDVPQDLFSRVHGIALFVFISIGVPLLLTEAVLTLEYTLDVQIALLRYSW